MMLGLKTSIGQTNAELWSSKDGCESTKRGFLDSDDFMEVVKYRFPPNVR